MPRQIQGSQRDFSYGEVDVDLKRSDEHPARKGGLRQMANARIHNSGTLQNRSGRRALYPITNSGTRTERFTIAAGKVFDIQFAAGRLKIIDNTGATVGNFTLQGNGAALPWASVADINSIVYAILGLSMYVTFAGMRPQVITFDGISSWSIADYAELIVGSQKRTFFYRISPQGITLLPSLQAGLITVSASAPVFSASQVGTRIRYINRQLLITAFISSTAVSAVVQEPLPGSQQIAFATNPNQIYSIGDIVNGSASGSKGIVTGFGGGNSIFVQLISQNTSTITSQNPSSFGATTTFAFLPTDAIVGPGGSLVPSTISGIVPPQACTIWDEEVMNSFRGYPASCFVDQFRLGLCNFPVVPGGIGWSAINAPTDLYVGAISSNAMFELAPDKVQVRYVVPGPESSEFVFCDRRIYYIPISPTNPLRPGSVQFQILSGDGCAQVQPRLAQEAILYVNAGQNSMMAVIATGAYFRPFNTKSLSDFHAHLFTNIIAIAAPGADGTFNERYAYVLNSDGTITVGKYRAESLLTNEPVIGWGPWSGAGAVTWIGAFASDIVFTSSYFGNGVVEILDDTQYLDAALPVNNLPTPFVVGGKGPLWLIAPGQTVTLMDQVTRNMGTYQVDANGFIVPQFNGGEDLTRLSLVAGQQWNMTIEPFTPLAQSGSDMHQRMKMRQIAQLAAHFLNSSGFTIAMLFSSKQSPLTPALGTMMNQRRVPAYFTDEDATLPPILREWCEIYSPTGSSYDPRVAIIKDTPGPLLIAEIAMEISI